MERAQGGDHAAFDALATAALDRLWGIARRTLRDPTLAEDAVQECLVRAWRDIRALRDPDRLDAWLNRLVVNACMDQARRDRRTIVTVVAEIDASGRSDAGYERIAERDRLERGFRQIPVDHRAVLVLRHYLGLRSAEIATTLGIPIGTVESRLHYASEALRAALEADDRDLVPVPAGRVP